MRVLGHCEPLYETGVRRAIGINHLHGGRSPIFHCELSHAQSVRLISQFRADQAGRGGGGGGGGGGRMAILLSAVVGGVNRASTPPGDQQDRRGGEVGGGVGGSGGGGCVELGGWGGVGERWEDEGEGEGGAGEAADVVPNVDGSRVDPITHGVPTGSGESGDSPPWNPRLGMGGDGEGGEGDGGGVETGGRFDSRPPPDIINGEEEWEVVTIHGHMLRRGQLHYQVQWEGYEGMTWEPASNLTRAAEAIAAYERRKADGDVGGEGKGTGGPKRHRTEGEGGEGGGGGGGDEEHRERLSSYAEERRLRDERQRRRSTW